MTSFVDRLYGELDRQLVEVRTTADGIASRAGVLISAMALAAGILGTRVAGATNSNWILLAICSFGASVLFGVLTIAPSMYIGVQSVQLSTWITGPSAGAVARTRDLYLDKLHFLQRNLLLLRVIRVMYYLQGIAAIVAVVTALVAVGSGVGTPSLEGGSGP